MTATPTRPRSGMAEHTVREAEDQLRKAARYFAAVLADHSKQFLACRVNGVTMVVAVAPASEKLAHALVEEHLLGTGATIHEPVVLIPRYHEPTGEFAGRTGHVHLHVLNDVKLGRRVRQSGECLCGKKRGQNERDPAGHTEMCGECVRVAGEHGLTWA
jgi:hypothetical protein